MARAGYDHDFADFGREVLQSGAMRHEMGRVASGAKAVFEGIVPRDDNDWANSVRVTSGVEDINGLRAVGRLESSDPNAKAKEFGHVTFAGARLKSGRKSKKRGRKVFVKGSHAMNKAMRAVTSGGGEVGPRGR